MLHSSSHWRFARERASHKERRLLAFANGTPGGPNQPNDPPDPANPNVPDPTVPPATPHTPAQPQGAEGQHPAPAANVQEGQQRTREQTANALHPDDHEHAEAGHDAPHGDHAHGQETVRENLTAADVAQAVEEMKEKVASLLDRMVKIGGQAKELMNADNYKRWSEDRSTLERTMGRIEKWSQLTEKAARLEAGKMPPSEVLTNYIGMLAREEEDPEQRRQWGEQIAPTRQYIQERLANSTATADVTRLALGYMRGEQIPSTVNESTKLQIPLEAQSIGRDISGQLGLKEKILLPIYDQIQSLGTALTNAKTEEMIAAVEEGTHVTEVAKAEGGGIFSMFKWVSILDIIEGFKQVKDAYIEVWHQKQHLKGGAIAKGIARIVEPFPYGEDVKQELESSERRKNDEVKDKYVNFLKSSNTSFKALFASEHGAPLLEKNSNDPNRSRAVLEYAASKGWLYHLDDEQFKPPREKMIFGWRLADLVPSDWHDEEIGDYYYVLLGQNKQGAEKEENETYTRIKDRDDTPIFIKNLANEIDGVNLWAALGVAKRAMERGLYSEVSPWLATTLLRKLSDPKIRKFVPRSFLDKIGSLSAYHSAFTLGIIKQERKGILDKWLRSSSKDVKDAGTLGNVTSMIREEILSKTTRTFPEGDEDAQRDLDKYISKVLAGYVLDSKTPELQMRTGEKVSIYSDKYTKVYRDSKTLHAFGTPEVPGVGHEDPDYYTLRCDNILGNEEIVKEILSRTGQGSFKYEDKARLYMGTILELYMELKEDRHMDEEAENFRKEMGGKLALFITDALGDPRSGGLINQQLATGRMKGKEGLPLLLHKGFFDISIITTAHLNNKGDRKLSALLLKQNSIDIGSPGLYHSLEKALKDYERATEDGPRNAAQLEFDRIVGEWKAQLPPVTWQAGGGHH